MAQARPRTGRLPLSALISQTLVAFAVELDNEFERQMPHRTTDHGATSGSERLPWLVSMAMWVHCMRYVPAEGLPAGELAGRSQLTAKSMQMVVKRMSRWWGYLLVEPGPADSRTKPPPSAWLVRPTRAGRQAQQVWEPLTSLIEDRWRARFGAAVIDLLGSTLGLLVSRLDVELPDYPPIGGQSQAWRLDPSMAQPAPRSGESPGSRPPLWALLSKMLLAFALDFERRSDLSLALSANVVRVLDGEGVRVRDLPALTGVAEMGVGNSLSILERGRYVTVGREPAGGRTKLARLTEKGHEAQDAYDKHVGGIERAWQTRLGEQALGALRESLQALVGGGTARDSPLLGGLEPNPDGWRAQVPEPDTLPHYPMVSHRGGFPDGS